MESYRLTNKLDCSGPSNKYYALKYDFGQVKSEKYGEATISGHFLLLTRHGELDRGNVHVDELKEKAHKWLNEMGLQEYYEDAFEKICLHYAVAYTAPGTRVDNQKFYFMSILFTFIIDDAICKLKHLNKNNPVKDPEDFRSIAEGLILIIEGQGDDISMAAAIDKLNPLFRTTCISLAYICRYSFEHLCKDDQKRFAREVADFIKSIKWIHEYRNLSYTEDEYIYLRKYDIALFLLATPIYYSQDINISDEIRMHPLFLKYLENVCLHLTLLNDIISLPKELANNEGENIIFIKNKKYSLQRSIKKTQETLSKVTIDVKKMGFKLKSYFPSDHNVANCIKATEFIMDGFIYWHLNAKRYGNYRYEAYEVEFDSDYDSWFEKICEKNVENLKEPVLNESYIR